MRGLAGLALLAAGWLALSTPGGSDTQRAGARDAPPRAVARVGGRPITTGELASFWFRRYPEEYARTLDALIEARLARAQARAHGLGVPREVLTAALSEEVSARKKHIETTFGSGVTLASQVRDAYGMEVAAWEQQVLLPRLYDRLLLDRAIRWDTRRRERVHVRVIVRPDEASARSVAADVRRGADFGRLAMRLSKDPTAAKGGDLPWIGRGDMTLPGVEPALFGARRGALVGPLRVQVGDTVQWHLYKVVDRHAAWPAAAPDRNARLEADLRRTPVDPGEYERWRARALRDGGAARFTPEGKPW